MMQMIKSISKLSSIKALALLLVFIALFAFLFSLSKPQIKPGECVPESYCREWINGSCSNNLQYTERECYRVAKNCERETYYERMEVEASC